MIDQSAMINAIFVPKSKLHDGCEGIYLYRNLRRLQKDEDFCNRPFGKSEVVTILYHLCPCVTIHFFSMGETI